VFTGLIQALGTVQLLDRYRLQVNCTSQPLLNGLQIGDSVAVDGACLTVETLLSQGFIVTVSPETLQRTTLGQQAKTSGNVNLEPALRIGDRLGGHFVTGHVDGLGTLKSIDTSGSSWRLSFTAPTSVAPYLIPKGSIAVNGISLTVAECDAAGTWFGVAVIPHSFAQTNLQSLQVGQAVNLEADLLGKYTAKLLQHQFRGAQFKGVSGLGTSDVSVSEALESAGLSESTSEITPEIIPEITLEYLAEHGFG
jgi:riboflavin synthase